MVVGLGLGLWRRRKNPRNGIVLEEGIGHVDEGMSSSRVMGRYEEEASDEEREMCSEEQVLWAKTHTMHAHKNSFVDIADKLLTAYSLTYTPNFPPDSYLTVVGGHSRYAHSRKAWLVLQTNAWRLQ